MSQYGGVQVLLSRPFLVAVVEGSLDRLASAWGLRPERSRGEQEDCTYAYVETAEDAFTLVAWDEAEGVEVYAHIAETSAARGLRTQPPLKRFLALAGLGEEQVLFGLRPEVGASDPDPRDDDSALRGPSLTEVLELPRSVTGLGLDQPADHIRTTVRAMAWDQLQQATAGFCSGWPGEDEHMCECTVMDDMVGPDDEDVRPLELHVEAESLARSRVEAWWWYEHCGPALPVNGIPVREYLERFAPYDRR